MIGKVIAGLVVLGIVAYFLVSLGGRAQDAQESVAVSHLQKQIQEQRAQLQDIEGGIAADAHTANQPQQQPEDLPVYEDEAEYVEDDDGAASQ